MEEYGVITERDDLYDILNLGAILFAKQIKDFPTLKGKEIIVRRYQGTNNRILSLEYICQTGYAIGFKDLVDFISKNTSTESIEIRREAIPSYPIVAIGQHDGPSRYSSQGNASDDRDLYKQTNFYESRILAE